MFNGDCDDALFFPNDKCTSGWKYWTGTEFKDDSTLNIICSGTLW